MVGVNIAKPVASNGMPVTAGGSKQMTGNGKRKHAIEKIYPA